MLRKIICILWCMPAITCLAMDDHMPLLPPPYLCAICLKEIGKTPLTVMLPCKDCFCDGCIKSWRAKNPGAECPTCRAAFPAIKALRHHATVSKKHVQRATPIPLPIPTIPLPQQLLNAIVTKDFARAQELLDLGFDIHIGDDMAIKSAINVRCWKAVRWLIKHGIDVHFHHDAIIKAVLDKSVDWTMVFWLLNYGIDVHYNDDFIMHKALAQHNLTSALKLAACGANINIGNGSILTRALKIGNFKKARELIHKYHVQVPIANITKTIDALRELHKKSSDEKIEMLAFLVDHGLKCDDILQFAYFRNFKDDTMFEWLIAHGGNIHVADGILMRRAIDNIASSYAHFCGDVLALIDYGFDIHFDNDEPMQRAIDMRNVSLIYGLIKRGIDIHFDHDAPMRVAQETNNQEFVHWLQENGAQK